HAQSVASATISGRVTTEAGEGILAANVTIGGLNLGALTNDQGQYSITIPASRVTGAAVVVTARRIGFTAKSLSVVPHAGAATTANFTLSALPTGLDAIVVTAL